MSYQLYDSKKKKKSRTNQLETQSRKMDVLEAELIPNSVSPLRFSMRCRPLVEC